MLFVFLGIFSRIFFVDVEPDAVRISQDWMLFRDSKQKLSSLFSDPEQKIFRRFQILRTPAR
jgi:hypothetical protein